ncbi:hypothetical protein [Modestobacter sp. I12A-02662]|uniref:hypothetical protein n=1 Tax=Modestobacter sp. I12A-02662 TaxID=1730496 RepID=UPI0034DFC799
MRATLTVYGVLYVVLEVVGHRLTAVSWPEVTALDVAAAVTDAMLTVAVLVAVLVGLDVLGHRWHRWVLARDAEQARLAREQWAAEQEPIGVRSWRPARWALPAAAPSLAGAARPQGAAGNAYGRPRARTVHAFPEDDGRLL